LSRFQENKRGKHKFDLKDGKREQEFQRIEEIRSFKEKREKPMKAIPQ